MTRLRFKPPKKNSSDSRGLLKQLDELQTEVARISGTIKDPAERKRFREEAEILLAEMDEVRKLVSDD